MLQPHAAPILIGFEPGADLLDSETADHAFQERQVHAAHEIGVLAGQGVEGAVVEHEVTALSARLVSVLGKDVDDGRPSPARLRASGAPADLGHVAELAAGGDGLEQQLPGQLVAALGKADLHPGVSPAVQLGGSAGARPAAPSRAAVLEDEKSIGDQTVEMELGDVVGDADARRRLLPPDRSRRRADEPIQRTADGITEGSRSIELGIEI